MPRADRMAESYDPERAARCAKAPPRTYGDPEDTPHFPQAVRVVEARDDGHTILAVRCVYCRRPGELHLDLANDSEGVIWREAEIRKTSA